MCANVYAIVLAGGVGSRLGAKGAPKQFIPVRGKPVICHTLERFEACGAVDGIVVPCLAGWCDALREAARACGLRKPMAVVPGGADRQASVRAGLAALPPGGAEDIALIHDGVRPLVRRETILENIRAAREWGAAMTVRESPEAAVVAAGGFARLGEFAPRERTLMATSPQSFRVRELMEAYGAVDSMPEPDIVLLDAAMVYARAKGALYLVREPPGNVKITTREDLFYFAACLAAGESGRPAGARGEGKGGRRGAWEWI